MMPETPVAPLSEPEIYGLETWCQIWGASHNPFAPKIAPLIAGAVRMARDHASLTAERDALAGRVAALARELADVEQTLGRALGYPRYADDPASFPGATAADGVCTGEHTAATLAAEAAGRVAALERARDALRHGTDIVPDLIAGIDRVLADGGAAAGSRPHGEDPDDDRTCAHHQV